MIDFFLKILEKLTMSGRADKTQSKIVKEIQQSYKEAKDDLRGNERRDYEQQRKDNERSSSSSSSRQRNSY